MLVYMTDDGKFHDVIDDESTFAESTLEEINNTQGE